MKALLLKSVIVLVAFMHFAPDVNAAPGRIYWSETVDLSPLVGIETTIKISELDGSSQQSAPWITDVFHKIHEFDAINDQLYWAFGGQVWRVSTDGSNAELVNSQSLPIIYDIDIDLKSGMVFVVSGGFELENQLTRFNLDGSDHELLLEGVRGVEIDPIHARMYYTVGTSFYRAGLDATNATEIFSAPEFPNDVAIDPGAGKIYWVQDNPGAVLRANFDGTELETLISDVNGVRELELDLVHGRMYYSGYSGSPQFPSIGLRRANFDGSNEEQVATTSLVTGFGIDPFDTTPVPASSTTSRVLLLLLVVISSTIVTIRH